MGKDVLLKNTIQKIKRLPLNQVKEVNDFVEFLVNRVDDQLITEGIQEITTSSKSYDFLKNEPDLYSVNDLKVPFK